ncbi:hypothetical protein ACFFX0_13100 [Citricoccus parietis]|uniref:Uncharacterized protein n=1 Tax=Citricoccus parietis TaxID=592307 RepID=A0ABV5FZH1_9MICC
MTSPGRRPQQWPRHRPALRTARRRSSPRPRRGCPSRKEPAARRTGAGGHQRCAARRGLRCPGRWTGPGCLAPADPRPRLAGRGPRPPPGCPPRTAPRLWWPRSH